MKTELYKKIFDRMDELGAIRKDTNRGCLYVSKLSGELQPIIYNSSSFWDGYKIIGHPPVLSDCIKVHMMGDYTLEYNPEISQECQWLFDEWELSKPYLEDQSDELGEKLLFLIS